MATRLHLPAPIPGMSCYASAHLSQILKGSELRSMNFFRLDVAPILSGLVEPSFWTHIVCQAAHQEQAAKHALLAISSLYENFDDLARDAAI